MMLKKPQNKVVEQILTDCYNSGREAVLKAFLDFIKTKPHKNTEFLDWYRKNEDNYMMKFRVSDDK